MQSEKTFLKDVELLIQIYLEPLRRDPKSPRGPAGASEEDVSDLLSGQDVNGIFSNIEQVLGVNRALLEALEEDHSIANVAAAFSKMAEYLKVYSIYCSNQDTALRLVEEQEKKLPKFAKWLKVSQKRFLSRGLDLRDFLIKPTQRICKYPLFLRELIGNLPTDSPWQKTLLDVDAKIQAVVSHINEQRRLKQGLDGVAHVYERLASEYPLVTSQRVLVFQGSSALRETSAYGSSLTTSGATLSLSPGAASGPTVLSSSESLLSSTEELLVRKGSLLGGLKRISRRGSAVSERPSSPGSLGSPRSIGSPRLGRASASRLSSSSMVIDDSVTSKEAYLFLFNDLLLYCRPCKTIGRKGLLDVHMELAPDKIRLRTSTTVPDAFLLRILKDGGPAVPTKFVFQCKDVLELESWIDAFDKINPFTPISKRHRLRDPSKLVVSLELEAVDARFPSVEKQNALLRERLQVFQLKTKKVMASDDQSTSDVLSKLLILAYALPQWKFQAKELRQLCDSVIEWLSILAPLAQYAKVIERGESGIDKTYVSLRAHKQKLQMERSAAALETLPPPLPTRDPSDYEEWDEVEEEVEEEVDDEEYEDNEDGFDVDKLTNMLREKEAEGMSVSDLEQLKSTLKGVLAPGGPKRRKKKKRWVKVKKKRSAVVPSPMPHSPAAKLRQQESNRKSRSLPSSPVSGRKKMPGNVAPQRAVPALPPPTPDYAHEDLRKAVSESKSRFEAAQALANELWNGYRTTEREILLKIEALQQLVQATSK